MTNGEPRIQEPEYSKIQWCCWTDEYVIHRNEGYGDHFAVSHDRVEVDKLKEYHSWLKLQLASLEGIYGEILSSRSS